MELLGTVIDYGCFIGLTINFYHLPAHEFNKKVCLLIPLKIYFSGAFH